MPVFFVPSAASPEQAEEIYNGFVKATGGTLAHPTARLFRIAFPYERHSCIMEVGAEPVFWPDKVGPVLAIIETTTVIRVHTQRSVLAGDRIFVAPDKVAERVYFDGFRP